MKLVPVLSTNFESFVELAQVQNPEKEHYQHLLCSFSAMASPKITNMEWKVATN